MNHLPTHIQIDWRSETPVYLQITEQVRGLIAAGVLKTGDQLPTVRQLATELRVNFNTVARAYRMLDEAGLISTQQGRGTYIWASSPEDNMENLQKKNLEELAVYYLQHSLRLGYSAQQALEMLEKVVQNSQGNPAKDT